MIAYPGTSQEPGNNLSSRNSS